MSLDAHLQTQRLVRSFCIGVYEVAVGDERVTLGLSFFGPFWSETFGLPMRGLVIVTLTLYIVAVLQKTELTNREVPPLLNNTTFFVAWTPSYPHGEGTWGKQEVPCSEAGCWKLFMGL